MSTNQQVTMFLEGAPTTYWINAINYSHFAFMLKYMEFINNGASYHRLITQN